MGVIPSRETAGSVCVLGVSIKVLGEAKTTLPEVASAMESGVDQVFLG